MDPDNPPKDGKELVNQYLQGDDVATIVGIAAFQTPQGSVQFANAFVDYSDSNMKEVMREGYAKSFEEYWAKNEFAEGFELTQRGPETVRVASRSQTIMMAFDGETNVLQAPSFFVDLSGDKEPIELFYKRARETDLWVLHIKTIKYSYLWILDYPEGKVLSSRRKDPITIEEKHGQSGRERPL